jgi:hypothetical protein
MTTSAEQAELDAAAQDSLLAPLENVVSGIIFAG